MKLDESSINYMYVELLGLRMQPTCRLHCTQSAQRNVISSGVCTCPCSCRIRMIKLYFLLPLCPSFPRDSRSSARSRKVPVCNNFTSIVGGQQVTCHRYRFGVTHGKSCQAYPVHVPPANLIIFHSCFATTCCGCGVHCCERICVSQLCFLISLFESLLIFAYGITCTGISSNLRRVCLFNCLRMFECISVLIIGLLSSASRHILDS